MVLLDTGDADIVVAPISSRSHGSPYDVAIPQWRAAGLVRSSFVRLHKANTVQRSSIHSRLGALHQHDRRQGGSVLDDICRQLVGSLGR